MTNFNTLKKSSTDFDKLLKEVEKLDSYGKDREVDQRYWTPAKDKAGNALAVIRFLPAPAVDGDDALPWVKYWDHGFQNELTGKWYIENSLTTLGQDDPVSEYNSELWNSTTDDNSPERKQARDQKRRLHYVSNIYVVSDPKNPENEGKVFLFKYGKKIFDKIKQQMNPDLETEPKINPFDFWKGKNFKLKVTKQAVRIGNKTVQFPNYDESVFLNSEPLANDEKMKTIWESEYSLKEIIDPSNFKPYDVLKKRLNDVLGNKSAKPVDTDRAYERNESFKEKVLPEEEEVPFDVSTDEEDPDLARFRSLADD